MHPESPPDENTLDEAVSIFVELRPRLFGIAYRVLGSTVEAEDVVQEVWLRWQRTDRSAVVSPAAFLSSATTRLAINAALTAAYGVEQAVEQFAFAGPSQNRLPRHEPLGRLPRLSRVLTCRLDTYAPPW